MKHIFYVVFVVFFLNACSVKESGNQTSKTAPEVAENQSQKTPDMSKAHFVKYDWDKDGLDDMFYFEDFDEEVVFQVGGKESKFIASASSYGNFTERSVIEKNEISDSSFAFLKINQDTEVLFLKDRGDFSGEIHSLWKSGLNGSEKIWEESGELIEVNDIDGDNDLEIVLKEIQHEPGSTEEYDFVNFILFKVFTYNNDKMVYDSLNSVKYNMANTPDYEKALGMKEPILARKKEEGGGKFHLILDYADLK